MNFLCYLATFVLDATSITPRLCSDHFQEDDLDFKNGKIILKPDVVPSIFTVSVGVGFAFAMLLILKSIFLAITGAQTRKRSGQTQTLWKKGSQQRSTKTNANAA